MELPGELQEPPKLDTIGDDCVLDILNHLNTK